MKATEHYFLAVLCFGMRTLLPFLVLYLGAFSSDRVECLIITLVLQTCAVPAVGPSRMTCLSLVD